MGKNSGYVFRIDTGGMAIARHSEQEPKFREAGKCLIHYIGEDYMPVMVDGKEKTGLIDSKRLKVIGMYY